MPVLQDSAATRESRLTEFRRSLGPRDRRSLAAMASFIVLLHVLGFGVLFGLVIPHHYQLGGDHPVFTVGVGRARLHLRAAARLRRRPHRGGRQHHPQADGRQRTARPG